MADLDRVLDRLEADFDQSLERLFAFMRIPSISTDAAYAGACRQAAEHIARDLAAIGFEASVRPTPGQPMVVAHSTAAGKDRPHVLFYGHYDVQPVDPLSEWRTPPFEPRVVDRPDGSQAIVGRGAADDKGQVMTFVEACRALMTETGALPVNVSVLLEGEEESGSPSLAGFLEANKRELTKDIALVCDTALWNRATPGVPTMLRGMVSEEFTVAAASRDLHSGAFGPAARNPNHVVAAILAALHDEMGRVTLPGFYDDVGEPPAELKAMWGSLNFSEAAFLKDIGLSIPAGEAGRSVLEMIWSRPTCEVNGMIGGYTGEGFKAVIPAKASAKVSFRLVGRQDPNVIREAFRAFVRERIPADCSVVFRSHGGSPALALAFDHPFIRKAMAALEREWGVRPVQMGLGGSIPAVGEIKRILGMDSLLVGFSFRDDAIHSPNEKYELPSFRRGTRSWVRMLDAFAREP